MNSRGELLHAKKIQLAIMLAMTPCNSPWLQFKPTSYPSLANDTASDVAVVGAGISGVTTLYSLLTTTNKHVVLLERDRVASGATGHNAGLALPLMEKPFSELVSMLGEEKARKLYAELDEG
ncbi:MAG: FAD-binding oxidoreductase, partial [Verrucomicrobia bacterium]|nr:FAD-binding oxidoreductase [Verrucomicrobiota bacterium]